MKKCLCLFFAFVFVVGVWASVPVTANAASTSDLTFKLNEAGTGYEITGCKETASGTLTIPETYNGKPVVGIAFAAFNNCSSISVLKFSKNIKYCSTEAFIGCSFDKLYIPTLENWCAIDFSSVHCSNPMQCSDEIYINNQLLTELNITSTDNIKSIGDFAFFNARGLKKVNISGSVTEIGWLAFGGCTSLTSVVIGNSLELLGGTCFYNCTNLKSVALPDKPLILGASGVPYEMGYYNLFSGTPIASAAYNAGGAYFYHGKHLMAVFPDRLTDSIVIKDGTLSMAPLGVSDDMWQERINVKKVTIPGSIKVLPEAAFLGFHNLEEVSLGYGVKEIGELAFARTGIYSVEIPSSVESIGESAFYNCENMDKVWIPSSVKFIDEDAFGFTNDGEVTGFTIFGETGSAAEEYADENGFDFIATNKKVSINDLEFTLNSDGKSYSVTGYDEDITGALVIPSTYNGKPVTSVCSLGGAYVSSIVIPDSVTSWPGAPEGGYSCLETVTVGNGLTSCPSFFGSVVKVVNLGTGIKNFSIRAFDWCGNLKEINIASGNPNYTSVDGVVFNKNKTTLLGYPQAKYSYTYTIPSTVTKIAETAFLEAHEIYNVKIPGSVKIIEESAFNTCPNLQSVVITSGTTTIGEYAFYDCQKLNSITIPASVTSIGKYAFGYLCLVTDTSPGELIKNDGFTIYGAAGSAAEKYAKNNGFKFVASLQSAPATPVPNIKNTNSGVKVSWNAVDTATSYIIYRKTYDDSTGSWSSWKNIKSGYTSTSYTDKETLLGVKYKYTVQAVNGGGKSGIVSTKVLQCDMVPTVKISNASKGISVTWNKINGAQSYIVYRREYDASTASWGSWGKIKSGYTSTSYTDTGAVFGVKYKYTVKAVRNGVKSSKKSTSTLQRNVSPTVSVANKASGVKISWNSIYGAQSYTVYRKTYNDSTKAWGAWEPLTSNCTSTSFVDKKAVLGAKYKYTALAVRDGFKGSFVETTLLQRNVSPTVETTNASNGINVTWNSVYGAQKYIVYRKTYNDTTKAWGGWETLISNCTATSYTDTKALLGVNYKYTVVAVRGNFNSTFTETTLIQRNVSPVVKAVNASNGVNVTWNSIYGAQSYIVYRKTYNESTAKWGAWETLTSNCTSTSYVDKNAALGAKYMYTVVAVRNGVKSSFVATNELQRNVSPTVKISNKADGVNVTWNAITGSQSYIIYRDTYDASAKAWSGWKKIKENYTSTSYVDKTALLGVQYKYTVRAVRGNFKSSFVGTTSLQRNISPAVSAVNQATGVKISWNSVYGAQSYIVYRKTYDVLAEKWGAWESINGKCTSTSYVDKKAVLGERYKYTVVAVRGDFRSTFIETTLLQRNAAPTVTIAKQSNGIKVNWTSVYGAQNYTVYRKTYNATTKTWGGWQAIKTGCTGTSYTDTTVKNGTYYRYTVCGVRNGFQGSFVQSTALQYVK